MAGLSRPLGFSLTDHWPAPLSLATTRGISVDVFSSGYLDVSVPRVRLVNLCIQSTILLAEGVSPFGYPRINDRSHLPAAFRSVPRPSSPPGAKASTERPYLAREPFQHRPRAGPNRADASQHPARLDRARSAPALLMPQPTSHTFGQITLPRRPIAGATWADNPSARSDSPSQRTCPNQVETQPGNLRGKSGTHPTRTTHLAYGG